MNTKIQIKDRFFTPYISRDEIAAAVGRIASKMNQDLAGKNPLFLCVLNGAFVFAADLFREMTIDSEISFIRMKSYEGMHSTGEVKQIYGLQQDITGRTVVVVEDIVDTGITLNYLVNNLKCRGAASVEICTLLDKPERRERDVHAKYSGFVIPNEFVVGYGLDFDEKYRNLPEVCVLKQ